MTIARSCMLAAALCATLAGCGVFSRSSSPPKTNGPVADIAENELLGRLRDWVDLFTAGVDDIGSAVAEGTNDTRLRRQSLHFRMRAIGAVREILWRPDLVTGFLDLWVIHIQFAQFFTEGEGDTCFGPFQEMAIERMQRMLEDLERRIAIELGDRYEKAHEIAHQLAKDRPIREGFSRLGVAPKVRDEGSQQWTSWLPSLNPFSGVESGIDEGARALAEFNKTSARFTDVVEFLPTQLGWQLELFQLDIEERGPLKDTSEDIGVLAKNVVLVAETARELPAKVRVEVETALESLQPKLAEVRETLTSVEAAAKAVDATSVNFGQTAKSMEAMAAQLDDTFVRFDQVLQRLGVGEEEPEPDPNEEPGKPFDVLEFDVAARSLTAMAAQLQETLTTFQGLLAEDALPARVAEVGASAKDNVGAIILQAALAACGVLVVFFALLLCYLRLRPAPVVRA